jgi:hypothetical protein
MAVAVHSRRSKLAGTVTGQRSSVDCPAASCTVCSGSAGAWLEASVAFTVIGRGVALRSVSIASKRSPSRTTGGSPA